MEFRQDETTVNANFAEVERSLLPARLRDSQQNHKAIAAYLHDHYATPDGRIDASQIAIHKAIESQTDSLEWDVPPVVAAPAEPDWDYPPVPVFMDFVRRKIDIITITHDGRLQKWFKTRFRDQINQRVNFILKNHIGEED